MFAVVVVTTFGIGISAFGIPFIYGGSIFFTSSGTLGVYLLSLLLLSIGKPF